MTSFQMILTRRDSSRHLLLLHTYPRFIHHTTQVEGEGEELEAEEVFPPPSDDTWQRKRSGNQHDVRLPEKTDSSCTVAGPCSCTSVPGPVL